MFISLCSFGILFALVPHTNGEIHNLTVNQEGYVPPHFKLELYFQDPSNVSYVEFYYDGESTGQSQGVEPFENNTSSDRRRRSLAEHVFVSTHWTITAEDGQDVIVYLTVKEEYNNKVFGIKDKSTGKFLNYTLLVKNCPVLPGMSCSTNYIAGNKSIPCEFGTFNCTTECVGCVDGYYTLSQTTLEQKTCQGNADWDYNSTICKKECGLPPSNLNLAVSEIITTNDNCTKESYNRHGCVVSFECPNKILINNTCLSQADPKWDITFDCNDSSKQAAGIFIWLTALYSVIAFAC